MWKDFFYFSRPERQGIIVLAVLITGILFACRLFFPAETETPVPDEASRKEYASFMDSIKEREYQRINKYPPYSGREKREITLSRFDPNTTDSIGFLNLGLPQWMATNILRYRSKGGKFSKPEDFRKIYGLTETQYQTLAPYISIEEEIKKKDTTCLYTRQNTKDTLKYYKYPEGTVIDLNRADTTELKKIPGIGSGIAKMIIGYRKQLGGFYAVEQLQDIHLDADKLRKWLSVQKETTRRINLNKASIERLKAHPYINFYQAKAIVEYRKKKKELKSLGQLALYEEFTEQDLERIAPYVCFE